MSKAREFIARHKLDYKSIDLEEQMPAYLREMELGLNGEPSSLLMLPSFIVIKNEVRRNKKIVCVDAGGTNLRISVAYYDSDGVFCMDDIARHSMPGVEQELGAQEFFDMLAEYIAPFCTQTKEVVMSFAYPANTTEDIDAELLRLTKEIRVKDVLGRHLAQEITASMARKGTPGVSMIVMNDTVASSLSGRVDHADVDYGAYTGTILGTGSNSCYPELKANIGKISNVQPDGIMMINTEAGNYDKLPLTDIDRSYDANTLHPGRGLAEKMTSGAYLGTLCEYVLKQAAEEGVFRTRGVHDIGRLPTAAVSEFLESGSGIIAEYMINDEDEANARELLRNIVQRAARLAALQMAAVAVKSHKSNNRICMSIEGTTYEKMHGLKEELHDCLHNYLATRGIQADIVTIRHAVLKGCAIAGLAR